MVQPTSFLSPALPMAPTITTTPEANEAPDKSLTARPPLSLVESSRSFNLFECSADIQLIEV